MSDLAEYERRISYALARIGKGVEAINARVAAGVARPAEPVVENLAPETGPDIPPDEGALTELRDALEAERDANAQLSERVRAIREKQETTLASLERKLAAATKGLDEANHELVRIKHANTELAAVNRDLTDAARDGLADPELINRAMQVELESLRAGRDAEIAELDGLLGALEPLLSTLPQSGPQPSEGDHA
ncbi:hypothetical protein [Phaeovulum sp.]|uniref:hypothetical protein n=1 Tax=Phaeovulum sp. TaxID=2934796 RepID=UPI0039E28E1F